MIYSNTSLVKLLAIPSGYESSQANAKDRRLSVQAWETQRCVAVVGPIGRADRPTVKLLITTWAPEGRLDVT